jgi:hypothetical protein
MDSDLFINEELDLTEHATIEHRSPCMGIASQPIRDGSRAAA